MNKILTKLFISVSIIFGGGMFTSCNNSLEYVPNPNDSIQMQLVRNPDVVAWSGQQNLGNTFGTRVMNLPAMYTTRNADSHNYSFYKWDNMSSVPQELRDKYEPYMPEKNLGRTDGVNDEAVSQAEADYVIDWIKTHEGGNICNLTDYWLQNVGSSFDTYTTENLRNGSNQDTFIGVSKMNQIRLSLTKNQWNSYVFELNDFNGDGKNGSRLLCIDCPIDGTSYQASYGSNEIINAHKFYYITIPNDELYGKSAGKTYCYIGFDYRDYKNDNGIWDFMNGDGDYSDWVIKLSPADGTPIVVPGDSNDKNDSEEIIVHNNEIEVNYAILDEHTNFKDLVTKLSIHVRHATDVEIKIPIPADYTIDTDDLYIFNEHYGIEENYHGVYGKSTLEYQIGNNTVTLTVSFEDNNIVVRTDGINQEVIDWCFEHNNDGINFEVYNYFNLPDDFLTRKEFKENYMDKATIEFLDSKPDYYINAFGFEDVDKNGNVEYGELGDKNHDHATVTIIDEQINDYSFNGTGLHLNSTPYNDIWVKKGKTADSEHPALF